LISIQDLYIYRNLTGYAQKFVAPYWLDLDASGELNDGNAIYFRETQDSESLARASKIVREAFAGESGQFLLLSENESIF
jgi:hypothetical protein